MFSRRSILTETARQIVGGTALANKNKGDNLERLALNGADTALAAAEVVNVVDFGADPTGRVDCSYAISRAIERCFSRSDTALPRPLYFPAGRFLIMRNNLFHSSPTGRPISAWTIVGAGRQTTLLIFKPVPTPGLNRYYLYDGMFDAKATNPNQTLIGLRMLDLGIQLECAQLPSGSKISCFRQFGSGLSSDPEQNWTFENCSFRGDESYPDRNGTILEIEGDANGSENAFISCRAIMFEHVIDCLNPQAVNHLSLFCHWEVIVGDMFRFIRGGNLALYGGSLILNNLNDAPEWKARTSYPPNSVVFYDGRQFRTNKGGVSGDRELNQTNGFHFDGGVEWFLETDKSAYLLRVGGDLTGQINTFLISGARIELRSNRSKLLGGGDLNTGSLVTFENIAVQPVLGGPRHTIELAESSVSVRFLNCKLSRVSGEWDDPFAAAFGPGPDSRNRRNGAVVALDGCVVSQHIHELSVWGENSNAVVALNECIIGYQEGAQEPGQSSITEVNGMASGSKHGTAGTGITRDLRNLLLPFEYWPGDLPEDNIHVNLPPLAIVVGMRFMKRSTGGDIKNYQIFLLDEVGNVFFKSDPANLGLPFEIITPRLYARPNLAGFRLTIHGNAQGRTRIQAGPDDSILLEWM
jgi:hypothetical protein